MKKLHPTGHWDVVKKDNGADKYCMKEDTRVAGPWEYGLKPVRVSSKVDWADVKAKAIAGELDKIPPNIYVGHYHNL